VLLRHRRSSFQERKSPPNPGRFTAQAEAGPGTLADYPVPGGDARLLIHYAPGSRAYRFNLATPGNHVPPGTSPEPRTAPGNQPRPHGPSRSPETPHGNPAADPGDTPGAAGITVTIWHNVVFDGQGRHTAMLDGYQPGDPMVRVFAYQASPGRSAEEIADEAFDIFNDHPRDPGGADLACAYYRRRLRSLSFPGNSPCCSRSCCPHRRAAWPRSSERSPGERTSWECQPVTRRPHR
jgi:hypothetical protein